MPPHRTGAVTSFLLQQTTQCSSKQVLARPHLNDFVGFIVCGIVKNFQPQVLGLRMGQVLDGHIDAPYLVIRIHAVPVKHNRIKGLRAACQAQLSVLGVPGRSQMPCRESM